MLEDAEIEVFSAELTEQLLELIVDQLTEHEERCVIPSHCDAVSSRVQCA